MPENKLRRERRSEIIIFRVSTKTEAQLSHYVDPGSGLASTGKVARTIMLEALAEREKQRRLAEVNVNKIETAEVLEGEAEEVLTQLPARCVNACVTSPPYWRKRDYGHPSQLGRERTPDQYVQRLARILYQVQRVLKDDGTLWLNLDDTYYRGELVGIPWRVALELQRLDWRWRGEIVWAKTPKPEPVKDRPTRAHEAVLMFSKRRDYFYDYDAVLEPHDHPFALDCLQKAQKAGLTGRPSYNLFDKEKRHAKGMKGMTRAEMGLLLNPSGRNARDVWTITPARDSGDHSAVMPLELAERCILAGSKPGDLVLDPFCGCGTTGVAALKHHRRFVGIELVARFVRLAQETLMTTAQGAGQQSKTRLR
ncbi:MAG: site-specific DNA-methyltransferase [Verrucomicrobiia bacterium]